MERKPPIASTQTRNLALLRFRNNTKSATAFKPAARDGRDATRNSPQ